MAWKFASTGEENGLALLAKSGFIGRFPIWVPEKENDWT
jgi:hypothetical protein